MSERSPDMAIAEAPKRRGRPADPAKREAVLEVARGLFAERGFGIGLETIAAEAGVSRQTIYNLFASKDELITAMVRQGSEQITEPLAHFPPGSPPEQVMARLAETYLEYVLSERSIAYHRLLAASAPKFTGLGPAIYAAGAGRGVQMMADYLRRLNASGRLKVEEPEFAAEQFFGMLLGHNVLRRLLLVQQGVDKADIQRRAKAAVAAFLRAYKA